MTSLNLELLTKLWELAKRGDGGEAISAKEKAISLAAKYGYTVEDIPLLLSGHNSPQPEEFGGFKFYDMNNPDHQRERARHEERRRAEWAAQNKGRIDEIIQRYGSLENVFKYTALEKKYDKALKPLADKKQRNQSRTWDGGHDTYRPSARMKEAAAKVVPIPTNIFDALAEDKMWEKLWEDRNTADHNGQYEYLSEGADVRRSILRELLECELISRNIDELIGRIEHFSEFSDVIEPNILIRDLRHIAGKEKAA